MALSYILGGIVFAYTIAYAVKRVLPIMHYSKCVNNEELKITTGAICEKVDEQNRAIQGSMVNLCFPKYEFEVDGKKWCYQSTVAYQNASIGQTTEIGYCERTGEAWAIQDIPLMKKNLIAKTVTMLSLLILLAITEVML